MTLDDRIVQKYDLVFKSMSKQEQANYIFGLHDEGREIYFEYMHNMQMYENTKIDAKAFNIGEMVSSVGVIAGLAAFSYIYSSYEGPELVKGMMELASAGGTTVAGIYMFSYSALRHNTSNFLENLTEKMNSGKEKYLRLPSV